MREISKKRLRTLADGHIRRAGAHNTDRVYRGRWEAFLGWALRRRLPWQPARIDTITMYLSWLGERGLSESTVRGALAAIRHYYQLNEGVHNESMAEEVSRCARSVVRKVARNPERARPLRAAQLREIIGLVEQAGRAPVPPAVWARDKALLLLGWGAALRRSELAQLDWESVTFVPEDAAAPGSLTGVQIHVRRSKRDQLARGKWVSLEGGRAPETCPVRALWHWRRIVRRTRGPVFVAQRGYGWNAAAIHPSWVNLTVKRYVALLGEPASAYSAHSLRAGWATDMLALGASEPVVARHLRHRDKSMLRVYYRPDGFAPGHLTERAGL